MSQNRKQRTYAALAHDTACLQQMTAVLVQRHSSTAKGRAGFLEEVQLYAVSMEELAVQMAAHSPALGEVAHSLYKGFTRLFQRALEFEEARLAKERDAHAATTANFKTANAEARGWRESSKEAEGRLAEARAALDDKVRALGHTQLETAEARAQVKRIRSVLDSHVLDVAGSAAERGDGLDPSIKLLQESVAKVDACAADAEVISAEVGQS